MLLHFKNALVPASGLTVLAPVNCEPANQILLYSHGRLLGRHISDSPAVRHEQMEMLGRVLEGGLDDKAKAKLAEMLIYIAP